MKVESKIPNRRAFLKAGLAAAGAAGLGAGLVVDTASALIQS
ncbi:MAG: twin-arginine translocation signal domain-containing protein, partial [Acidobacteriales bacterium]|nr:twin-arginine translocation signal domain-containing protein [Terriglobales bacterium]